MKKSIILSEIDKQKLAKYAEAEKPYESCAILVGDESDENWTVNKVFLTENPPTSLTNFLIQNKIFILEDGTFDYENYKYSIDNNIQLIPDSLVNIFTNYENQLKNNDLLSCL